MDDSRSAHVSRFSGSSRLVVGTGAAPSGVRSRFTTVRSNGERLRSFLLRVCGSRSFGIGARLVVAGLAVTTLVWVGGFVVPQAQGASATNMVVPDRLSAGANANANANANADPFDAAADAPSTAALSPVVSPFLGPAQSQSQSTRATVDNPVLLNSASLDDLRRLPGIGPKRAKSIVELRDRIGRFRHAEDLLRIKGIGRATLKKLKPLVRVDTSPDAGVSKSDAGTSSVGVERPP